MEAKISIIIPVYNAENTIEKCIRSLISQSYKELEIIVVDDGSNDDTVRILNRYQKNNKRIKIIEQNNSGVSAARNNGIDNATGKYVMFVDSDDWLEKNMIEEMYNCIVYNDVDAVRCNYFNDYLDRMEEAKLYNLANKVFFKNDNEKYINMRKRFVCCNQSIKNLVMLLLVKKEYLEAIRFNTRLYMMEDVLFYQELFSEIDSIFFLDKPLYHYVENINSTTNVKEKFEKMIYGVIDANRCLIEYLNKEKILFNYYEDINYKHFQIITDYLMKFCNEYKKEEFYKLLKKLYKTKKFNNFIFNINIKKCNIEDNISLSIIKKQKWCLLYFMLKIKMLLKKIIKKLKCI